MNDRGDESERGAGDAGAIAEDGGPLDRQRRRRHVILLGTRLAVVTLFLGGVLLLRGPSRADDPVGVAIMVLIAATFASSLGVAVALPSMRRSSPWASLQVAWDLCLVTGLTYLLGGAVSGFSFLYGVVILAAALAIGSRAAQLTTAGALTLYVGVSLGLANGWLPAPAGVTDAAARLSDEDLSLGLLRNVVGFVLVGLLASGLAERLRRTGGQLVEAEKSAAELGRLNEDILRSLGSGLLMADLEGRVARINPAGAALLGGSPRSFVGREATRFLPVELESDAGRDRDRGEGTGRREDKTPFPVGYSTSPLRDAEGRHLGTLVLFQDLTELRQLRDKAERAERLAALGRLSAGLAHEIRNPLGSISGSVELVREAAELSTEDRGLLAIVLSEVDRLDDLVTTMLDVARPREPELADLELTGIASEVVRVAKAEGGPTITLDAPSEPVPVRADPGQLRQVLWNLVKNAMQFSPAGGTVRVAVTNEADGSATLSVRDEGAGIPASEIEHVFDMFYSKRRHGIGLGLALVRQIVDAHGGEVHVRSSPGAGTTFTVRLTRQVPALDPDSSEPESTVGLARATGADRDRAEDDDGAPDDDAGLRAVAEP